MTDKTKLKGADRTPAQLAASARRKGRPRTDAQKAADERRKGRPRTDAEKAAAARRKGKPASPAANAANERQSAKARDAHFAIAAEVGYKMIGTWVSATHSIEYECLVGHRFMMLPGVFKRAVARHGSPCTVCPTAAVLRSERDTLARLDERGWTALSKYEGSKIPMKMRCDQSHIFWMQPDSVKMGNGCQTCYYERQEGVTNWTTLGGSWEEFTKPAIGYVMHFPDNEMVAHWKLGISDTAGKRINAHKRHGAVVRLGFQTMRGMAYAVEQVGLDTFDEFRSRPSMPDGWYGVTECLANAAKPGAHIANLLPQLAPKLNDDGGLADPQYDVDFIFSVWERCAESRIVSYEERFRRARFQLDKCFDNISTPPSFKQAHRTYELTSFAWLQFLTYWRIAELYGATIEHRRELLWAVLNGQSVGDAFGSGRLRMKRYTT